MLTEIRKQSANIVVPYVSKHHRFSRLRLESAGNDVFRTHPHDNKNNAVRPWPYRAKNIDIVPVTRTVCLTAWWDRYSENGILVPACNTETRPPPADVAWTRSFENRCGGLDRGFWSAIPDSGPPSSGRLIRFENRCGGLDRGLWSAHRPLWGQTLRIYLLTCRSVLILFCFFSFWLRCSLNYYAIQKYSL